MRRLSLLLLAALLSACAAPTPPPTPAPTTQPSPVAARPTPASAHTLDLVPAPLASVAPLIIARSPAPGEQLAPDAPITLTFDRPMDQQSVATSLSVDGVKGALTWPTPRTARFTPSAPLSRAASYAVTLAAGAKAVDGASTAAPISFRFPTAGFLSVAQVIPAPGTADADAKAQITVIFNRPVVPLLTSADLVKLAAPVSCTPAIEGGGEWLNTSIFRIAPGAPLTAGASYTCTIRPDVADTSGAPLQNPFSWSFTVAPPQVLDATPAGGSTVPVLPTIRIRLNQAPDLASARASLTLTGPSGAVPGDLAIEGETMVFTPTQRLAFGASYRYQLAAGAQVVGGGAGLPAGFAASFQTYPLPSLVSTTPADGERAAQPYGGLTLTFSAPIDQATVLPNLTITPAISITQVYSYTADDGRSFVLGGGFAPSTDYTVTIGPNIADPYGNTIGQGRTVRFRTDQLPPNAQILDQGSVSLFSAAKPTRVGIVATNQPRVNLTLYALPADAVSWLSGPGQFYNERKPPSGAREIRRWDAKLSSALNTPTLNLVELSADGGPLAPGAYLLLQQRQESGGQPEPHLILVSAVSLTLKTNGKQTLVWATSLANGAPVAGLALRFFLQDETAAGSATTGPDGIATVDLSPATPGGEVIVTADQPFAAVTSGWSSSTSPWNFDLPFDPSATSMRADIQTDRPIYRPGQKVFYKGIIRSDDDAKLTLPPAGEWQVIISGGNGEQIADQKVTLSTNGSFSGEVALAPTASLGGYSISVQQQDRVFSGQFQVAAYRAPEFSVAVTPQVAQQLRDAQAQASVDVGYFFGGPVAGAKVTWVASATPVPFSPAWAAGFTFGDGSSGVCWFCWWRPTPQPQQLLGGEGVTGADGKLAIAIPATALAKGPQGDYALTIEATVVGNDNQAISGRAQVSVHPGDAAVGMAARSSIGRAKQVQTMDLVTATSAGERLPNQDVSVDLFRVTWKNSFVKQGDGGYWTSEEQRTPAGTQRARTDAQAAGSMSFTPDSGGSYRAIASLTDSGGRVVSSTLTLWVADSADISWERTPGNKLQLVTDRQEYAPGETATVLVPSPFSGTQQALITVERGGILSHEVRQVSGNSLVLQIPLTAQHVPNIYISVTLIAPPDASGVVDFAYGLTSVSVRPDPQTLKVTLTPDRQGPYQPGETVDVAIATTDIQGAPVSAELAVDMVDAAVLSLAPRTPDATRQTFYAPRPLGVMTASSMSALADRLNQQLEEQLRQQERRGSGGTNGVFAPINSGLPGNSAAMPAATAAPASEGLADSSKGAAPAGPSVRTEFADTAFWSPAVQTDAGGKAQVSIKLPDNLTTWSLRGVAVNAATQIGEGLAEVVSRKPLLVRPVAPRFFVLGDSAELAANVSNTTDAPLAATVALSATNVTVTSPLSQTVTVPANGEVQVRWQVKIEQPMAAADAPLDTSLLHPFAYADLVFSAVSGQYQDASRPRAASGPNQTLPIYRYSVPEVVGTGGVFDAAGSATEVVGLPPDLDQTNGELTVRLDPSLAAGIRDGLKALDNPDYESADSLVYSFLPNVLTARALKRLNTPDAALEARLPGLVSEALVRLAAQQKGDGGWGWYIEYESNPSTSAQVVYGLLIAKQAGYAVDETMLTRGMDYLATQLVPAGRSATDWEPWAASQQAWLLYVLAEGGRNSPDLLGDLFAARAKLGIKDNALLAIAIADGNAGDGRIKTILADLNGAAVASATGMHWEERERSWWYGGETFTTATVLHALVRLDGQNKLIPNAVRWLMAARELSWWGSAQDSAWAIVALTDYMASADELNASYDYGVLVEQTERLGGSVTPQSVGDARVLTVPASELTAGGSTRVTVGRGDGKGRLYYSAHLRAFLPVERVTALDRGIIVARKYVDASCADGALCPALTEVKLGQRVRVELTLTAPDALQFVRLEDPIPAGADIEDPTLATTGQGGQTPGPQPLPIEGGVVARPGLAVSDSAATSVVRGLPYFPWWGWAARRETRDDRVVLAADYLPSGSYQFSYVFRATLPGEFRVIPATASETTFPEVYGRSDGALLTVTR